MICVNRHGSKEGGYRIFFEGEKHYDFSLTKIIMKCYSSLRRGGDRNYALAIDRSEFSNSLMKYFNEIHKTIPEGLDVTCPDQTHVIVKGVDKQQVGQFAAEIRAVRKPEPYKGKGVRYVGEYVRRKAGKTAAK